MANFEDKMFLFFGIFGLYPLHKNKYSQFLYQLMVLGALIMNFSLFFCTRSYTDFMANGSVTSNVTFFECKWFRFILHILILLIVVFRDNSSIYCFFDSFYIGRKKSIKIHNFEKTTQKPEIVCKKAKSAEKIWKSCSDKWTQAVCFIFCIDDFQFYFLPVECDNLLASFILL